MLNPEHTSNASGADRRPSHAPPGLPSAAHGASSCARTSSSALLGGARELEIQHGEAVYRLRVTAMGKLILTK